MSLKKLALGTVSVLSIGFLSACGSDNETIRLGVYGEDVEEWEFVAEKVKDEGIDLELVSFTDYSQPNRALADGDVDLNAFQTLIFLENFNEEFGTDLVPIADTYIAPLGIYSDQIEDVSELQEGDQVAIQNDVTNQGRSLILLQTAGLIEVDPDAGITPTLSDITDNPLNLEFVELDASQTARALADTTVSLINNDTAVDAGLSPLNDPIFSEPVDENTEPYVNLIAVRNGEDREAIDKIVDAYQSEDTLEVIKEKSDGSSIIVWEDDL